jgi:hypothetical protein
MSYTVYIKYYGLEQGFPKLFAHGSHLALEKNHSSSHPCSHKYTVSGWQVSKIKNIYLRNDFRYLQTHTSSIYNNTTHDLP